MPKYYGIYFDQKKNRYISRIRFNGKKKHIGSFKKEKDAAQEVDKFLIENGLPPRNFKRKNLKTQVIKFFMFSWLPQFKNKCKRNLNVNYQNFQLLESPNAYRHLRNFECLLFV